MKILLLYCLLFNPICQSLEDGWKGIKPLITNRESVEKVLGKGEIDNNGYYNYRSVEAFVQVNYSTSPCVENQYGRGKYKIPAETVLGYKLSPKNLSLLSAINARFERYRKDTSGDLDGGYTLRNSEDGVAIEVETQGDVEYFGGAIFGPSKKAAAEFQCNKDSKER